jgi:hypothetical protein
MARFGGPFSLVYRNSGWKTGFYLPKLLWRQTDRHTTGTLAG